MSDLTSDDKFIVDCIAGEAARNPNWRKDYFNRVFEGPSQKVWDKVTYDVEAIKLPPTQLHEFQ